MNAQIYLSVGVPRVTVAIVTYRSKAELPRCVESVLSSTVPLKIVIIDNGSADGTYELATSYAGRYENVIAIDAGGNLGLSAGNNIVIPHIEGDYTLMLNPDTVLREETLFSLIDMMDRDHKIGVIGPKCLYENGKPHTSYHNSWNLGHLILWRVLPYSLTRMLYDNLARYQEREVDFVSGACLLIRSQLFKEIEGYDPRYFLTVEDVCDLCRRARTKDYSIMFSPRAEITHLCGRSGAHVPYLTTLEGYKGDIYHFAKYHGRFGAIAAYSIVVAACGLKILVSWAKAVARRRAIDKKNLEVYQRILPMLLRSGPAIAFDEAR